MAKVSHPAKYSGRGGGVVGKGKGSGGGGGGGGSGDGMGQNLAGTLRL